MGYVHSVDRVQAEGGGGVWRGRVGGLTTYRVQGGGVVVEGEG